MRSETELTNMNIQSTTSVKYQAGTVLVVTLIMVVVMTIVGVAVMGSTLLSEKIVSNAQEKQRAFEAADSATRYAISMVNSVGINIVMDLTLNASNSALYDLRKSGSGVDTSTGNKLMADWGLIRSAWPWNDASKRAVLPSNLGVDPSLTYIQDTNNPMNLSTTPQFVIGMRARVPRKGTEGQECVPFDIIGAAHGSNLDSESIIELKTILVSVCGSSSL